MRPVKRSSSFGGVGDVLLAESTRHCDEVAKHRALDAAGILHAHHREREQVFIDARRRKAIGSADLAPVLAHRLRTFRTTDAKARRERLRVRKYMVADPGQRKIGDDLLVAAEIVEPVAVRGIQTAVRDLDARRDPARVYGWEEGCVGDIGGVADGSKQVQGWLEQGVFQG